MMSKRCRLPDVSGRKRRFPSWARSVTTLAAIVIGASAIANSALHTAEASSHDKLGFQLPGAPGDETAVLQLPDKPSIAVLAFTNMSGDPEQEYFADGTAEDIITDLSKISGLFVISRSSSFAYKGTLQGVSYFWHYKDSAVANRFTEDVIRAGRFPARD